MFVYGVTPAATQTSNATPNTANDCFFIAAGTGRATSVLRFDVVGRGAGLTSISGLSFRIRKWTTTASSGGTAITPAPKDPGAQAAKATAGYAAATVTSGTGGPTEMGSFGCGAAGPGSMVAMNPDAPDLVESGSADSIDIFNVSGSASLVFELSAQIAE